MTAVKALVNKEVKELTKLLEAVQAKLKQVSKLYTYIESADGIEKIELIKLINLCEGSSADEFSVFAWKVKYLAKPRVEGNLYMSTNGRYRLDTNDFEFTSGCPIEVYIPDPDSDDFGWQFGRVEYSESYGGYYFYNQFGYENHRLWPGMRAAVR
ncbi:DUF5348 domain-containing protein [Desulfolucanica intricata]|uniref:DUF5348 domain-containing protein n=1 Tax=Desulfolucanica intricata TaxID=1285191 RepID=UPI00082E61AE|nr:DUF5348 domain-containing protein [Desulfolucanica intricata]